MVDKEMAFNKLIKKVKNCRKCSRMDQSERVLSPACGSLNATIVFVGEAPGRLGADDSQIPFHGDKSGNNFEALLEQVGLSRYDVFVSNAVLCNPKDHLGNNSTPTQIEIRNCAPFLAEQLDIVQPKLVASLGATALKSCDLIEPHHLTMRSAVRTLSSWRGSTLVPIYHPGQRAMMHRSFANQLADYQFIAETVSRNSTGKKRKVSYVESSTKICAIVDYVTQVKPQLSYFALHKILFLAEVRHLETVGKRLTQSYIVRQKDGPYCVELHPKKLIKGIPTIKIISIGSRLFVSRNSQSDLLATVATEDILNTEEFKSLNHVLQKYGEYSDARLKTVVYLKRPMRELLRKEKLLRSNLFNSPLLSEF
jgi:uracil-DNA glycosylase family 4